jgi:tetraacyldisaccharide 4'-kinase
LREARDALAAADAILTADDAVQMPEDDERPLFKLARRLGEVRTGDDEVRVPDRDTPVLVVSGIANPARFVSDVTAAGCRIAEAIAFRDHHPYTPADVARIAARARAAGAAAVLTTEKDFVRLLPFRPFPLPVAYLPLTMDLEPAAEFGAWLAASLRAARDITVD